MGVHSYATEDQHDENMIEELWKQRLVEWRDQNAVVSIDGPTRLSKARKLGYKAKNGFCIVRSRVPKGNSKRERLAGGRRPKRTGQTRFHPKKSKRLIAELRASKKFSNLEVLNSYWLVQDGSYKWFEVIMVDPDHPEIRSDEDVSWIADQQNRVERGLTPAGRESRGLRNRGTGAEKVRPSQSANDGKGK